jgi:hypothetical protein
MGMGRLAASNVFSILYQEENTDFAKGLAETPKLPPMIAIAIGGQAVTYTPDAGIQHGKDVMKTHFSNDLAWASRFTWSPVFIRTKLAIGTLDLLDLNPDGWQNESIRLPNPV